MMLEILIKLFLCHYFSGLNALIFCFFTNQNILILFDSYMSYSIYILSFLFYLMFLF